MKKLSLLLLAGILLLTPSCDFMKSINPFGKKAREAEALRQQQEAFRIADSIRVVNESRLRLSVHGRPSLQGQRRRQCQAVSGYHVIVGSFLTPAYADAWLEHIKGFGYDARIVDMNGGKWQLVSAKSFPDLRGAWNALGSIQDNINSEAWVYRKQ